MVGSEEFLVSQILQSLKEKTLEPVISEEHETEELNVNEAVEVASNVNKRPGRSLTVRFKRPIDQPKVKRQKVASTVKTVDEIPSSLNVKKSNSSPKVKKQKVSSTVKKNTENRSLSNKKKLRSLKLRNQPKHLYNGLKSLSVLQKKKVIDMGFGSLLDFKCARIPSKLGYFVVDNFDTKSMSLKLEKGDIQVTRELIQHIFGIPCGGTSVESLVPKDKMEKCYVDWRLQFMKEPTPTDILKRIKETKDDGILFVLNFIILFLNSMVECDYTGKCKIDVLERIDEDVDIKTVDWCGHIYECLKKCKKGWIRDDTLSYFTGPVIVLILIYLELTSFKQMDTSINFPATKVWSEDLMKKREVMEIESGIFGRCEIKKLPENIFAQQDEINKLPEKIAAQQYSEIIRVSGVKNDGKKRRCLDPKEAIERRKELQRERSRRYYQRKVAKKLSNKNPLIVAESVPSISDVHATCHDAGVQHAANVDIQPTETVNLQGTEDIPEAPQSCFESVSVDAEHTTPSPQSCFQSVSVDAQHTTSMPQLESSTIKRKRVDSAVSLELRKLRNRRYYQRKVAKRLSNNNPSIVAGTVPSVSDVHVNCHYAGIKRKPQKLQRYYQNVHFTAANIDKPTETVNLQGTEQIPEAPESCFQSVSVDAQHTTSMPQLESSTIKRKRVDSAVSLELRKLRNRRYYQRRGLKQLSNNNPPIVAGSVPSISDVHANCHYTGTEQIQEAPESCFQSVSADAQHTTSMSYSAELLERRRMINRRYYQRRVAKQLSKQFSNNDPSILVENVASESIHAHRDVHANTASQRMPQTHQRHFQNASSSYTLPAIVTQNFLQETH